MNETHERLVAQAEQSINAVFGDMSVTKQETLASMEQLASNIQACVDVLEHELGRLA